MAKILFVDDEPDIELLAKQKFRKQIANSEFEILFAQNGHEALELMRKEPGIAVVVSDVNMPEMDGLTLLDKLKENYPTTKAIVVSAYGDTKTLRAAMNKGAFDFVTKPVDFNDLADAIERTLAQYHPPSSSLYSYQLMLASLFPHRIDLNYSHSETTVLWDAFATNTSLTVLIGVSIIPSPIPSDIAIGITHAFLKSTLIQDLNFSLSEWTEKLETLSPFLKAEVLVGSYYKESHVFTYKTTGEFKAHHISFDGQTILSPSQTALLNLGDVIMLTEPHSSTSHLSFTCIQEE
ncbi:MAG: response regulator [Alphaproteobacteria bacterium]|nr:response regulator [Alphaproteobacteria bacterium]